MLLFFLLLLIILYNFIFFQNKNFIILAENKEDFYIIPEDKGGEKVKNLDKKSLNLKSQENNNNHKNKLENLLFSIQFYTNNSYENVSNYLNNLTKYDENIYQIEDFYILALSSDIGIDYFLLYKSFKTRKDAQNYCINFLNKIDNCLIVDTNKF